MATAATKGGNADLDPRLLQSFAFFVWYLWCALRLRPRVGAKLGPTLVQYDIAEYLHRGPRRRMVKAFRGVGKSWLTAAYVLWRLLKDPNERILVVSGNSTKAREFSTFCRQLIEQVDILHRLRPAEGQRDSVVGFDVAGADPHQQPSMKSLGITSQLQGNRATIIVADDVETFTNSLTQTLRDKLSDQVKEFDAILLPDGEIIYLGTDQTAMSLYGQLPARGYEVRIWPSRVPDTDKLARYGDMLGPCIQSMVDSGRHGAGAPTDPLRFDDQDLMEREASYGRTGFAMQFMLDPSFGDANKYPLRTSDLVILETQPDLVPTQVVWGSDPKLQLINDLENLGLDGDRFYRPMHVGQLFEPPQQSVMFIDPSGRGLDETGVAVVRSWGPMLYCTHIAGYRDGFSPGTLQALAETARSQAVNLILVEPNFGGGMFNSLLEPYLVKAGYPCTVEDAPWSKSQKELRIADTLEPVMNQHKLVLSRSVVERDLEGMERSKGEHGIAQAMNYSFIYQMTRLTRERGALVRDDRLEALAGACFYFAASMRLDADDELVRLRESQQDEEVRRFLVEAETGRPWWDEQEPEAWNRAR